MRRVQTYFLRKTKPYCLELFWRRVTTTHTNTLTIIINHDQIKCPASLSTGIVFILEMNIKYLPIRCMATLKQAPVLNVRSGFMTINCFERTSHALQYCYASVWNHDLFVGENEIPVFVQGNLHCLYGIIIYNKKNNTELK